MANAGEFLLPSIIETILQRALTEDAKNTEITISQLGKHATSLGAISLILEELF
jgi:hypothetical protein